MPILRAQQHDKVEIERRTFQLLSLLTQLLYIKYSHAVDICLIYVVTLEL